MPKWAVTHEDGRVTEVHSDSDVNAKKQANHQEMTNQRKPGYVASIAVSAVKVKE